MRGKEGEGEGGEGVFSETTITSRGVASEGDKTCEVFLHEVEQVSDTPRL